MIFTTINLITKTAGAVALVKDTFDPETRRKKSYEKTIEETIRYHGTDRIGQIFRSAGLSDGIPIEDFDAVLAKAEAIREVLVNPAPRPTVPPPLPAGQNSTARRRRRDEA